MSLNNDVNKILNKMHSQGVASNKGSYGEEAVFSICEDIYNRKGGILIHSFTYRVEPGLKGNIKRDGGLHCENLGAITEIDILLVTPYKIFPIEVKAYRANKVTLTNDRITGCANTDKSPVHQHEMHLRHLYPKIFKSIPDGMTEFIVPIVVFADQTDVVDSRTPDNREYIPATILNQLRQFIELNDVCYNKTKLNVPAIERDLRSCMTQCEKFLPYVGK